MKLIINLIVILIINSMLHAQMSEERKKELEEQYSLSQRIDMSALKGGIELWYFDNKSLKEPVFLPDLFLRPIWKGKIVGYIELKSKDKDYVKDNYNEINKNYFNGNSNGSFGISYFAFSFLHPLTFIDEFRIGYLWLDFSRQSIYAKYSLWGFQIKSKWNNIFKNNFFFTPLPARGYVTGFQFLVDKIDKKLLPDNIFYLLNGIYNLNGYYYKLNNDNSIIPTLKYTEKVVNFQVKNKQIFNNFFIEGSYAYLQFRNYITNKRTSSKTGSFWNTSIIFKIDYFSMKYRYTFISDEFYSYSTQIYMSRPIFGADYRDFFEPIRYKPVIELSEEKLIDNYFEAQYYNKRFGAKFFYNISYQPDYSLNIVGIEPAIFFYGVKYYPLFEYRQDQYKYLPYKDELKTTRVWHNRIEIKLYTSVILEMILRYEIEDYKNTITETFIKFLGLKYKMSNDVCFELEIKESSKDEPQNFQNTWWWDKWTRFWQINKYAFFKLKINF